MAEEQEAGTGTDFGKLGEHLEKLLTGFTEKLEASNKTVVDALEKLSAASEKKEPPPKKDDVNGAGEGSTGEEEEEETETGLYTKEQLEALSVDHIMNADKDESKKISDSMAAISKGD